MKAAEKSWRRTACVQGGSCFSDLFRDRARDQPVVLFSPNLPPSLHLPIHHISVQQFFSFERLWREQEGLKTREGRSLEFAATLNAGKRVAVYNQRPEDAERNAQLSSPLGARPRLPQPSGAFGVGETSHRPSPTRPRDPEAPHAPVPRASARSSPGPRAHPARCPVPIYLGGPGCRLWHESF